MATRLHFAAPIAREFFRLNARRLRPGGLAATLSDTAQDRPFIIVTGSGRSGTSAIARVLHESGISMGTDFDPPGEANAVGFYEDKAVQSVNEGVYAHLGLSRIGAGTWPWRSTVVAVAAHWGDEMRTLASRGIDGWKDPRFSLSLEAWLPHLPRRPKIVLCLRSPEAFLHSIARIYGLIRRDEVERLWANELRRLLDVIRDYRLEATCVEYDELVQQPAETIAALSKFIGLPLDAQYIEPTLRHHVYAVPRRFAALYQEVRALGSDGTAATVRKRAPFGASLLDRLRGSPPLTAEESQAIDDYLGRTRAIEARTMAAKNAWAERVGEDRPKLGDLQHLDGDRSEVVEETRAASAAYVEVLSDAQAELGAQLPPATFERYHESLQSWVDRERLVAQLMLQATDSERLGELRLETALDAWQRFSSPQASERAQRMRLREYQRALGRSGHSGAD